MTTTPEVSIELEQFGALTFPNLTQVEITTSYVDPVDKFRFGFVPRSGNRVGDATLKQELQQERITIRVAGRPQLLGRIDRVGRGRAPGELIASGRSYMFELATCDVDPTFEVKDDTPLGKVLQQVASPVGIANIVGEDSGPLRNIRSGRNLTGVPPDPSFLLRPLTNYKPNTGTEKILAFMTRVAAREGFSVQPSASRDTIILAKPDYAQPVFGQLIQRFDGVGNNIKSSQATYDTSKIPTHVLRVGQARAAGSEGEARATRSVIPVDWPSLEVPRERVVTDRIKPPVVKADAGLYRLSYVRDRDSKNQNQLELASIRNLAEATRTYLDYPVTMVGAMLNDGVYCNGTLFDVDDPVEGVQQRLWCESTVMRISADAGTTTQLKLRLPGSYIY